MRGRVWIAALALALGAALVPTVAASAGTDPTADDAAQIVEDWSLDEQIAQLILFEVEIDNPRYTPPTGTTGAAVDELLGLVRDQHVAGFTLEEGNELLWLDPRFAEIAALEAGGVHPFVGVNEEGGTVQVAQERTFDQTKDWIGCTNIGPLSDYTQQHPVSWDGFQCVDSTWPPPGTHTEAEDVYYFPYLRDAFAMGSGTEPGEGWTPKRTTTQLRDVGRALERIHTNLDLAPVLGISNGTSTASLLGDRVFGDSAKTVETYAAAFSKGIHEGSDGKVETVVKHFPGLGTVVMNTDDAPGVSAPLSQLKQQSLEPYEHLDEYDPLMVMMSDAAVPGLTCPAKASAAECIQEPPASLTKAAYRLLRSAPYGWDGVIVTDTLAGGAVLYDGRTIEQAAREAVAAGADLIEIKPTPPPGAAMDWAPTHDDNVSTIQGAIAAIERWAGSNDERLQQIEDSAIRVVQAKLSYLA